MIILDIMLPPGKSYPDKDTHGGLRTGLFLYDTLANLCPEVPIVVLTNVVESETLAALTERNINVYAKADILPLMLVNIVLRVLASVGNQRENKQCAEHNDT